MNTTTPITIPTVGESITEGTLVRWLKKDGESVRADEPILELETEKASTEVPAPAAGKLCIKTAEGTRVAIGATVGEIERDGAATPAKPAPPEGEDKKPPDAPPTKHEDKPAPSERVGRPFQADAATTTAPLAPENRPAETPSAWKGRPTERESRQRMSAIRQRIAERLLVSQQSTASLTTFNEADMSAIIELRSKVKEKFKEAHGVGLGFMSFFVKACVAALKAYPLVNSRIDGDDVVTCNYWNIGVAVSTEKGLMVPVLRDADQMSFADIERAIADMAGKAREGKINVADLQGGTFTITNGGVFGSMLSTPILNPPQSAILGMHTIQERPVARDGQVVIRPMMYLALTYDHRLIDGREAVLFLMRVKECLECPMRLLLDA